MQMMRANLWNICIYLVLILTFVSERAPGVENDALPLATLEQIQTAALRVVTLANWSFRRPWKLWSGKVRISLSRRERPLGPLRESPSIECTSAISGVPRFGIMRPLSHWFELQLLSQDS